MRLRTFIVEDEPPATDRLRGLLATENEFELVGEATGNADTVAALRAAKPDVVFLDLHVPAGDGFSLLESARLEPAPAVVVVTAHGQYAVEAFDRRATDYLLKPFRVSRLQAALGRVRDEFARRSASGETLTEVGSPGEGGALREGETAPGAIDVHRPSERLLPDSAAAMRARHSDEASFAEVVSDDSRSAALTSSAPAARLTLHGESPGYLVRFVVRNERQLEVVPVEAVDWLASAGNYVILHAGHTTHVHRESMIALEERLDPSRFVRISRSAIVALDRIRSVATDEKGNSLVILQDRTKLPLTRGVRDLQQRLERG